MSRRSRRHRGRQSGRLLIVVGGLLTLVIGIAAYLWLQPASPQVATDAGAPGRLVASSATVDLGRVPFDKMVEAQFELANTGGGTVNLTGAPKIQMLEGC
ncbi:MAG: hypothetical protein IT305_10410 [Chloroflexi bacterium]|nr:hypothetical protein [Chloroflexota bacterium]